MCPGGTARHNQLYTQKAVEHLIGLGHRHIAFVGGDPEVAVTTERHQGYTAAMNNAGFQSIRSGSTMVTLPKKVAIGQSTHDSAGVHAPQPIMPPMI